MSKTGLVGVRILTLRIDSRVFEGSMATVLVSMSGLNQKIRGSYMIRFRYGKTRETMKTLLCSTLRGMAILHNVLILWCTNGKGKCSKMRGAGMVKGTAVISADREEPSRALIEYCSYQYIAKEASITRPMSLGCYCVCWPLLLAKFVATNANIFTCVGMFGTVVSRDHEQHSRLEKTAVLIADHGIL